MQNQLKQLIRTTINKKKILSMDKLQKCTIINKEHDKLKTQYNPKCNENKETFGLFLNHTNPPLLVVQRTLLPLFVMQITPTFLISQRNPTLDIRYKISILRFNFTIYLLFLKHVLTNISKD